MSKQKLSINNFIGAIVLMENYLDGAVADYENGDIENTSIIDSCIETIKLIYSLTEPILLLTDKEYEALLAYDKSEKRKPKTANQYRSGCITKWLMKLMELYSTSQLNNLQNLVLKD